VIDTGVYDRVRAFRAPNSLHPKTKLHKRRLTFGELLGLKVAALVRLASEPESFEIPGEPTANPQTVDDWAAAVLAVEQEATALAERRIVQPDASLNRQTRAFLVEGANHRRSPSTAVFGGGELSRVRLLGSFGPCVADRTGTQ